MKLVALALLALPALALAQGSLTPPGVPAPTMKTLTQIEPRTPLEAGAPGVTQNANGGFTVTASGSYYLSANLTVATGNAIAINSSGVTLDLNGFTLKSTASPASGDGINLTGGLSLVTIRNGNIQGSTAYNGSTYSAGPGFLRGISGAASIVTVEDVSVTGVSGDAIYLFANSIIRRCRALVCGDRGLNASLVTDSVAETCRGVALGAGTATNCTAASTHSVGLYANTATNCTGTSARSASGLYADTATNCRGTSDSGIGLEVVTSAIGSIGKTSTGAYGLKVGTADATPVGGTAENCRGEITGSTTTASVGLFAHTATNCLGINISGTGLQATNAVGCSGTSTLSSGILSASAINSHGASLGSAGFGLSAVTATDCSGSSVGAIGLQANNATTCTGRSGSSYGLQAENATTCTGESSSGIGLNAMKAFNCSAYTATGNIAMDIIGSATNCRGICDKPGGTAIKAAIAVSCTADAGIIDTPADKKFLGTP